MKKVLKWIGFVLAALIGLLLVTGALFAWMGSARLNKTYDFPLSNLVIPTDAASIEFGKHRAEALCEGCHGDNLAGIDNWFSAGPLGAVDSANLTMGEGGVGREYTSDEDYVRAIRHGIDPEGKPIFMVAVGSTSQLSDQDLGAIIAYIKSVPPVDHKTNGHRFTALTEILMTAGKFAKLPVEAVSHATHVSAPQAGVSPEYGEYLVNTNDCRVCHGAVLAGGPYPNPTITMVSPNLTPGGELAGWKEEQFIKTLRTGVTPSGRQLSELMPWKQYRVLHDDEMKAVWLYLQSLPKLPQWTN